VRGRELAGPGGESMLLGALLGAASLVLLTIDLTGGAFAAAYSVLAWLFVGIALGYWVYLYSRAPLRLDLWAVLFLLSVVFFAAGGIIGSSAVPVSLMRVEYAVQALVLLAVGLIASRLGFRLLCPSGGAGSRKAHLCARVQATRPAVVLACAGAVWGLRMYAASQGLVLSHAGDVMAEVGTGASVAIQLAFLGRPLAVFLGAVLAMERRPRHRVLGLLVLAGELLYSVLWARRLLLDIIVALVVVGVWAGRRLALRRVAVYAAVAAFTILVMWPFMFHLRAVADRAGLYGSDFTTRSETLLSRVIPEAIETFDLAA